MRAGLSLDIGLLTLETQRRRKEDNFMKDEHAQGKLRVLRGWFRFLYRRGPARTLAMYAESAGQISTLAITSKTRTTTNWTCSFSIRSLSHKMLSCRADHPSHQPCSSPRVLLLQARLFRFSIPSASYQDTTLSRKPVVIKRYPNISKSSSNGSKSPNFLPFSGPALHSPPRMICSHRRRAGLQPHTRPRF
ncbi:hypothetical protein BDN72DRAFT_491839 [Pluteus cervinus]|uniref:Uncharacterized protein n=1 Tax=Pluteus cervinus TaxID=181527 RepID=A0ACD3AZF3_9AGAR|nr:hypothetical protein BDN72DRAFT_491839 [Pluteus cervinus]